MDVPRLTRLKGHTIFLYTLPFVAYFVIKRAIKYRRESKLKTLISDFKSQSKEKVKWKTEEFLEQILSLTSPSDSDTQVITGIDTKGNGLYIKITLKNIHVAELFLQLKLSGGQIYQLPVSPQILVVSTNGKTWSAEGLRISVEEPFRILRISYNGFLRDCGQISEEDVRPVFFSLLWSSGSSPIFSPYELSDNVIINAFNKENQLNEKWLQNLENQYGYEQYGMLLGVLKTKDYNETTLHFIGHRRRYWGLLEGETLLRDISLFATYNDGSVFNIGVKAFKNGFPQLYYGTIRTANFNVYSIEDSNIVLNNAAADKQIPEMLTIRFKANEKIYVCSIQFDIDKVITIQNYDEFGWEAKLVHFTCTVNNLQGNGVATFWYQSEGSKRKLPEPLLMPHDIPEEQNQYVVDINSKECKSLNLAGGKGCSLSLLSSLNSSEFTVPAGFCIVSTALQMHLAYNKHLQKILTDIHISCGKQSEELEKACRRASKEIAETPVFPDIANSIRDYLQKLRTECKSNRDDEDPSKWCWAVRSSGIGEDSEQLSAAGQNKTVLGCKTDDDVLNAVAACWGSLYTFQSVQYRRQYGQDFASDMAVVVQRMVPAETAGVLFTCQPSTGDPSKITISANYGLGESVVSGITDPDTIIINKSWLGEVSLDEYTVGSKQEQVVLSSSGDGVQNEKVNDSLSKTLCINKDQALRLARIGVDLERRFGDCRDIEWAIYKNNIYLLQSRPITTIYQWSNFELLHEMDSPYMFENEVTSFANLGEVLPGATSTLTISNLKCTDIPMQTLFPRKGYQISEYYFKGLCVTHNHVGVNVLNSSLKSPEKTITLETKVRDLSVFGHSVTDEKLHSLAIQRHTVIQKGEKLKNIIKVFKDIFNNSRNADAAWKLTDSINFPESPDVSAGELYVDISAKLKCFADVMDLHLKVTCVSIFFQVICMSVLCENDGDLTSDHYYDIGLVLSSGSDVISAEIPQRLEKIGSIIKEAGLTQLFCAVDSQDARKWLEINCPNASEELDEFIERFGYRSLKEMDVMGETWAMNPSILLKTLQATLQVTNEEIKNEHEILTPEETVSRLKTPKSNTTRRILKFLIKHCRSSVAKRELSKAALVKTVNKLRMAYRDLAQKLVTEGYLPQQQLIFHLTHYEIGKLLEEKNPILLSKAMRRFRLFSKWNNFKFPEIVYGLPKPIQELEKNDHIENGVQVIGTPVCRGKIKARACVITNLEQISELQNGDILITHSTDIGWSPYFPMLSGVVTELGGLVSHGAVVAREYGLPCVVGTQGATSIFITGDLIFLDGSTGILTKIADNEL